MKTRLLLAFTAWIGCAHTVCSQQSVANWGQTHRQPEATLPVSRAAIKMPVPKAQTPQPVTVERTSGREYTLSGGWRMASANALAAEGHSPMEQGGAGRSWLNATVPGTVLTTLVDQRMCPDPYYGLNNMAIPDTLCRTDWWYRIDFDAPETAGSGEAWLLFNGINYRAEVWLNGSRLGDIHGAFIRGEFNATRMLRKQGNILAVHILPPPNPGIPHEQSRTAGVGMNGGQLCLDGPTFISSEGWDWVPGIRDRNIGIWQDVRLRYTRGVRLKDTQVTTLLNLPDTTRATVGVATDVENLLDREKTVKVELELAGRKAAKSVTLAPGEQRTVRFAPDEYAALTIDRPKLWWPNGYGAQNLYTMTVAVTDADGLTDRKSVRFGVRELTYELEVCRRDDAVSRVEYRPGLLGQGEPIFDNINRKYVEGGMCMPRLMREPCSGVLTPKPDAAMKHYLVVCVNGRRIFCKGGNWGMDDAMKRVSRAKLEPYFRLHKEANFNMVRNWTGESTEETFYELCDEYGMLVFNDFWLSTQGYNLTVNDDDLLLRNAEDAVLRYRNHPSIAVWNPRNEGFAPEYIEERLARMIALRDGTRLYSPNSTHCNLRPSGPWNYHRNPRRYYEELANGFNTEMGSTSIPTEETVLAMMDPADAWPISDAWHYHDFHNGQADFMQDMSEKFGEADNLHDFCLRAQLLEYDSHRAMMEAWNSKMWHSTSGLLLWMSHCAWPSMIWQVYSSDYETFGSFYGCRKACEPVHLQKNLDNEKVVIVNSSLRALTGARVSYEVFSPEGRSLYRREAKADAPVNRLTECFAQPLPDGMPALCMERLTLTDRRGRVITVNDYWKAAGTSDYRRLNTLPKASVSITPLRADGKTLRVELRNGGQVTALALKLNARDAATGQRVLPAYASDGYFNLLPGERRVVSIDCSGAPVSAVSVEGYNVEKKLVGIK